MIYKHSETHNQLHNLGFCLHKIASVLKFSELNALIEPDVQFCMTGGEWLEINRLLSEAQLLQEKIIGLVHD
jgi:hypothetical protein